MSQSPVSQEWLKSAIFHLLHLARKVEQRWSKVEQQGGRCSTLGYTPYGGYTRREVEQSPGPFAGVEQIPSPTLPRLTLTEEGR